MVNKKYLSVGVFFLFLQLLIIIRNVFLGEGFAFFWICDFIPLFFAVGFLLSNNQLIKGLVNVSLLVQFIFLINLVYLLISGNSLLGIDFSLRTYSLIYVLITIVIHLFSANVALAATYKTKPKRISAIYSLLFLLLTFFLVVLFTPPQKDINLVYSFSLISIPHYTDFWVFLAFLILVVPTYYFQIWLYNLYKRR